MRRLKEIGVLLGAVAIAIVGAAIVSPAQDDLRSESRAVSGFTGIDIGGAISADVRVGGGYEVTVEARADVLPMIKTEVKNNILYVHTEHNNGKLFNWKKRGPVKVTISLPELNDLDVSGASSMTVAGVNSDRLKIDLSGASTLSIDGNARSVDIDLSGASNLKALNLMTDTAMMDLSGASSAKISVASELSADASGASSVCYSGSPKVTKDTSGASSISGGCTVIP